MTQNLSEVRKDILKKRNVKLAPKTRKVTTIDDMPADFTKTDRMKYVELKYSKPVDELIWEGTLDEVADKYKIDRTTVSKWRKKIEAEKLAAIEDKFYARFNQA